MKKKFSFLVSFPLPKPNFLSTRSSYFLSNSHKLSHSSKSTSKRNFSTFSQLSRFSRFSSFSVISTISAISAISGLLGATIYFGGGNEELNCLDGGGDQQGNGGSNGKGLKKIVKPYGDGSQFYIPTGEDSNMKVFSGNGNWHLANEISMHLGTQLGRATVKRFPDGEVQVNIHDSVRGKDVFVIQPLGPPVNENLMELILIITTLRRASARKITAVIPYFGYSRSTKKREGSVSPIGAADVATMLQVAGADRIVAVDLHNAQIQGFFSPSTPVDNLDVSGIAIPYFETKFLVKPVIVSPDANGAARAKSFRDKLIRHGYDASLAVIVDHKQPKRDSIQLFDNDVIEKTPAEKTEKFTVDPEEHDDDVDPSTYDQMELVGSVKGRDCVIFDDMVDSARSITRCTKKLKQAGARRVFAFATHGLFLGKAYERIEKSDLIEVVCVNTLPLQTTSVAGVSSWSYCNKVHQLSVAALLAESIRRIQNKQSLGHLFEE